MSNQELVGFGDFHLSDNVFFHRKEDGGVVIYRHPRDGPTEVFVDTDAGGWCSAVLSVSAFGERAGDWHALMDHQAEDVPDLIREVERSRAREAALEAENRALRGAMPDPKMLRHCADATDWPDDNRTLRAMADRIEAAAKEKP